MIYIGPCQLPNIATSDPAAWVFSQQQEKHGMHMSGSDPS